MGEKGFSSKKAPTLVWQKRKYEIRGTVAVGSLLRREKATTEAETRGPEKCPVTKN